MQINQVQLDELYAVVSALRAGEISDAEAVERLSRSPQWVWTVIDPESKLLLSVQVGERTLAMAQAVLHQIAQLLAPGCGLCRKFCSGGREGVVGPVGGEIRRPGSRTVRPQ